MPVLDNWSTIFASNDPFLAPELNQMALQGNVYNHPRFDDGEFVTTSPIVDVDKNNNIITESGSIYQLYQADEKYAKKFPVPFLRLIDQIRRCNDQCVSAKNDSLE